MKNIELKAEGYDIIYIIGQPLFKKIEIPSIIIISVNNIDAKNLTNEFIDYVNSIVWENLENEI